VTDYLVSKLIFALPIKVQAVGGKKFSDSHYVEYRCMVVYFSYFL